jgi:hypothetical protein
LGRKQELRKKSEEIGGRAAEPSTELCFLLQV